MDPLGDSLTTRPIQTGWEFTVKPYPCRRFRFVDNSDHEFGNGLGRTGTRTRSDSPEPLLPQGRAAKTYVLPRRNLAPKTRRWPLWDIFQTWQRLSKHPGHSSTMMVWLHVNGQKDLHCHNLCLQRTSLEDELKYWMSAKSEESTIIQPKLLRIAHLKAFRTLKIGLTALGT